MQNMKFWFLSIFIPRDIGVMREREESEIYLTNGGGLFSQRQIPPNIFWCGGVGGEQTRECDIVIVYMCLSPRPMPRVLSLGEAAKDGFGPWTLHGRLPENLISSSTSSGKALVTTELDVLVCNTFSSGGRTQCVPEKCGTSSCEAPQAETHRLKSLAPPPAHKIKLSFQAKSEREKKVAHLTHCGTCGSVFVHLHNKTNESQSLGEHVTVFGCLSHDPTFQAFCMSDAQYSSRCFHNDDEVRS